jgi:hypothetical protein
VRARSKEIFRVQAEKSTTVGIVVGVSIELLRTSFEICSKLSTEHGARAKISVHYIEVQEEARVGGRMGARGRLPALPSF